MSLYDIINEILWYEIIPTMDDPNYIVEIKTSMQKCKIDFLI